MAIRDFFISHNSADMAHAEAINAALRDAGYETHFDGTDCPPGTNIPIWMNRALADSRQVIALCSPDYFKDRAVYSLMERMAAVWGDPDGNKARLVPVQIADCEFEPLIAPLARIVITGMTLDAAAAALVARLAEAEQVKRREDMRKAEAAPDIFFVPRPRNTEFSGHFKQLGAIHLSLSRGHNAAVTQTIAGLGGIGKTTLAAEYAHRYGTRGRYGGVWWVAAESESSIVQGLASLAVRLGRPESDDLPSMARWTLDELGTQTRPWLLIYDNVANADGLRCRLPSGATGVWLPAGSARVLITSRATDFTGLAEVTRLDEWGLDSTTDYLLRVTGRSDSAGAALLAEKLGGLPLAASQAAAFLKNRPAISFGVYAANMDRLFARARDPGNRGEYPETVFATIVRSLEVLPPVTQDLLCLIAWLSADGVQEELLIAAARTADFLPEPLGAALRAEFDRADMIKATLDLSLVRTAEDPVWGRALIVHRVVQAVLRIWQRAEGKTGWDVLATQIVQGLFPVDPVESPKDWPLSAMLLPHVHALLDHGPETREGVEHLCALLNRSGAYLSSRGDTVAAITMLEASAQRTAATFGEDHLNYRTALNDLARPYGDLGRLDDAEAVLLRVLQIEETLLGPNDPILAIRLVNLTQVYWKRKEFARAEPLMQRVAKIDERAHGRASHQYAHDLNALGTLYDDWAVLPGEQARWIKARKFQKEALRIARSVRGERHPAVSYYLHNFAVLLARQGYLASSEAQELRAAAIMVSLGRRNHPHTQMCLENLVRIWHVCGQNAKRANLEELLIAEIEAVEANMLNWVAQDAANRNFGPPPFVEHHGVLG